MNAKLLSKATFIGQSCTDVSALYPKHNELSLSSHVQAISADNLFQHA